MRTGVVIGHSKSRDRGPGRAGASDANPSCELPLDVV